MRPLLLIPLSIALLSIGCSKEDKHQKEEIPSKTVTINQIEKKITNKETNLGCEHKNNNSSIEECTEESNSAQFILTTIEKDLESKKSDITSIKHNLNISLKEITEEENKKIKLKDSLIALVNEVDESKETKRKKLKSFVDTLDDEELGVSNQKKIASIKNSLIGLVDLKDSNIKQKDVKKSLENLLSDVIASENNLIQTQQSLKKLVDNVEKEDTPSAKKFVSAIIKDVSSKKISILDENKDFFTIKVQRGDNLSILAKRYYNNKNKFKIIYEANKDKINEKYEIYPNSTLLIPKI